MLRYADDIVEAIRTNPVVVVIGETGSGKTTQISQILHKVGPGTDRSAITRAIDRAIVSSQRSSFLKYFGTFEYPLVPGLAGPWPGTSSKRF